MIQLRDYIKELLALAITSPEKAEAQLAQQSFNGISFVNFKAIIHLTRIEDDVTEEEKVKGGIWINDLMDPEIQVYHHLLTFYNNLTYTVEVNFNNIEVEGVKEWEQKWNKNIKEITNECSNDTGPSEMDPTEPGESDGILPSDDGGEQINQESLS